jgi:hypothetical protein
MRRATQKSKWRKATKMQSLTVDQAIVADELLINMLWITITQSQKA